MLGVPDVRLRFRDTTAPWKSYFLHSHPKYFLRVHHSMRPDDEALHWTAIPRRLIAAGEPGR
jgi:hypothetical protein